MSLKNADSPMLSETEILLYHYLSLLTRKQEQLHTPIIMVVVGHTAITADMVTVQAGVGEWDTQAPPTMNMITMLAP